MSQLSDALRGAANRIDRFPKDYNWQSAARCNCGHLVTKAANLTLPAFAEKMSDCQAGGTWDSLIYTMYGDVRGQNVCPVSKLPIRKLTDELLKMGMQLHEFAELEKLSNPEVLKRAEITKDESEMFDEHREGEDGLSHGFSDSRYSDKKISSLVVRYMRAWADIIDEKEALKLIEGVKSVTVPNVTEVKQTAQVAIKETVEPKRAIAQTL